MQSIKILYFGKHPEILETVLRLINNRENWEGTGATQLEEVYMLVANHSYNVLLLGCGIPEEEEQQLRAYLESNPSSPRIIQHYGGGSGLLYNEVLQALHDNNTPA